MTSRKLVKLMGSICLILALAVLPFIAVCPAIAKEKAPKPIKLIFTTYATEREGTSLIFDAFAKRVIERTNGRVTFKKFYAGALGGAKEVLPLCSKGTADIAIFLPGYYPGIFNLADVIGVPYTGTWGDVRSKARAQMVKEFPEIEAEFTAQNVKLLISGSTGDPILVVKDKRIEKVKDFKGMNIRSYGYWSVILKSWGATPVGIVYLEIHDALARGIIDAAIGMPLWSWAPIGAHEVCKYYVQARPGIGTTLDIVMNLDSYNKLPPDIQKIFDEEAAALAGTPKMAEIYMNIFREAMVPVLKAGVEIYSLSDEVIAELRDLAAEKVHNAFIKKMVKAGYNKELAQRVLTRWIELNEKYESGSNMMLFDELYEKEFK